MTPNEKGKWEEEEKRKEEVKEDETGEEDEPLPLIHSPPLMCPTSSWRPRRSFKTFNTARRRPKTDPNGLTTSP